MVSYLAGQRSPVGQYDLGKKCHVSYRQILRVLHQLEKAGLVRLDRTEPSSKGGKERKFWVVRINGGLTNEH